MAQASSSSSATTGIQSTGGSITKNSPGIWIAALAAVVLIFWIWKKGGK
jgi:hypothetical protein